MMRQHIPLERMAGRRRGAGTAGLAMLPPGASAWEPWALQTHRLNSRNAAASASLWLYQQPVPNGQEPRRCRTHSVADRMLGRRSAGAAAALQAPGACTCSIWGVQ